MPKVPVYGQTQVQDANVPGIKFQDSAPIESFGGGTANILKGAEAVAQESNRIYSEQKKKADQIADTNAKSQLSALETRLLYDPQSGALNKKGKDAFGIGKDTMDQYQKETDTILNSLGNEEQRSSFRTAREEKAQGIDRSLQGHISQETIRYDASVTDSLVKNETDAAIENYHNPQRIAQSVKSQEEALRGFGARNGLSEEEITQKVADAKSKTHEAVIGRMLANDQDIGAESYYRGVKDSIKGDDKARVEQMLEIGSTRGKAQRITDDLIKKGEDPEKALAIIGEKYKNNPKVREAAEQRLAGQVALRESLNKKKQEDLYNSTTQMIDSQNMTYDQISPEIVQQLDTDFREKLQTYSHNKAIGKDIITDPVVKNDLLDMAANPATRDKFISMDISAKYLNKLNGKDRQDLLDKQRKLRYGDDKTSKELDGYRTNSQIVQDSFVSAGYNTSNKKDYAQFKTFVDDQVAQYQSATGKKITNQELQKITDGAAMKVVTDKGMIFDSKKPQFQIDNSDDVKNISYKEVPYAFKVRAEKYLKNNGKTPSESLVLDWYKKYVGSKNGR